MEGAGEDGPAPGVTGGAGEDGPAPGVAGGSGEEEEARRAKTYFWNLRTGPVAFCCFIAHFTYDFFLYISEAMMPSCVPWVKG